MTLRRRIQRMFVPPTVGPTNPFLVDASNGDLSASAVVYDFNEVCREPVALVPLRKVHVDRKVFGQRSNNGYTRDRRFCLAVHDTARAGQPKRSRRCRIADEDVVTKRRGHF